MCAQYMQLLFDRVAAALGLTLQDMAEVVMTAAVVRLPHASNAGNGSLLHLLQQTDVRSWDSFAMALSAMWCLPLSAPPPFSCVVVCAQHLHCSNTCRPAL